ncbi:MAG TPA: hypothetical protein VGG39_20690 [Polyangiaceae bacterium]|jgi:hypothetical protein
MNSNSNKVNRVESYRAMIAGLKANVAATASIGIQGAGVTQSVIVDTLQAYVDAVAAVAPAQSAYEEAVAKQDQAEAAAHPMYLDAKGYALKMFGKQPTVLGTFDLQVPVRKEPSAATKAAAAAKRKATRAVKQAASAATAETPAPAAAGSGATTAPKA